MKKLYPPPLNYEQPVLNFKARSLSGSREYVDFIPESHLRIWYNTQTEGYANHYHNAMEIILCTENQYFITTGSHTYTLEPGDILIIPPYMLHELRSKPSGTRFIFLIDIDMLRCFRDYKALEPATTCRMRTPPKTPMTRSRKTMHYSPICSTLSTPTTRTI